MLIVQRSWSSCDFVAKFLTVNPQWEYYYFIREIVAERSPGNFQSVVKHQSPIGPPISAKLLCAILYICWNTSSTMLNWNYLYVLVVIPKWNLLQLCPVIWAALTWSSMWEEIDLWNFQTVVKHQSAIRSPIQLNCYIQSYINRETHPYTVEIDKIIPHHEAKFLLNKEVDELALRIGAPFGTSLLIINRIKLYKVKPKP